VSDFLAFVVQHGEIVLFLYVLADQLGVAIPAAPILLAAGGLAAAGRLVPGLGTLGPPLAGIVRVGVLRNFFVPSLSNLRWFCELQG
jgi:membrane protein DedA with SNARE-associated domain